MRRRESSWFESSSKRAWVLSVSTNGQTEVKTKNGIRRWKKEKRVSSLV